MNVGHVQHFLKTVGAFLKDQHGPKPATEFEAFCAGLEPFKELPLDAFAQFLHDAAEYKRTGVVPVTGKKGRTAKATDKPAPVPKVKPKTKNDAEAIRNAAARLQALYDRFADPTLTTAVIDAEVERVDKEFDGDGLKAVARAFGITSGISTKKAAKDKIRTRIVERKDRYERSEAFSAANKPPAPVPAEEVKNPPAAAGPVEPEVLVEELGD